MSEAIANLAEYSVEISEDNQWCCGGQCTEKVSGPYTNHTTICYTTQPYTTLWFRCFSFVSEVCIADDTMIIAGDTAVVAENIYKRKKNTG